MLDMRSRVTFFALAIVGLSMIGVAIWTNLPSACCGLGEKCENHTPVSTQASCRPILDSVRDTTMGAITKTIPDASGVDIPPPSALGGDGSAPADSFCKTEQGLSSACYHPGPGVCEVDLRAITTQDITDSVWMGSPATIWQSFVPTSPGLYELRCEWRCEVDTVYYELVPDLGGMLYRRTIDTTCVCVRHECNPWVDSLDRYLPTTRILEDWPEQVKR